MAQHFSIDGKVLDEDQALGLFDHGRVSLDRTDWRQRKVLDMVGRLAPQGLLLDVGCYSGAFTELVRGAHPGLRPIGCDAVDDHVRLARLLYPAHPDDYRLSSVYLLDFPDNCFDCITLQEVLEHLDRPVDALREIHRALKPGGVLIVTTPNAAAVSTLAYGAFREARAALRRLGHRPPRVPHEIFFAESDWNRHIYAWTVPTLTTICLVNGYDYIEHCLTGDHLLSRILPGIGSIIVLAVRKTKPAPARII
jgi:SAM-dependent methyltransferase